MGFLQDSTRAKALARGLIISQMSHLVSFAHSVTVLGRIVVWQALLKHKNDYYDYVQADCIFSVHPSIPSFSTLQLGVAAVLAPIPAVLGARRGFTPDKSAVHHTASLKQAAISDPIFTPVANFVSLLNVHVCWTVGGSREENITLT